MSKKQRLASFGGPSAPNKPSRVASNPPSPASQRNLSETTFHRKLRTILLDFRSAIQTWRDLISIDGVKAAKILIDTRTELDNALTTYGHPMKPIMRDKLRTVDIKIQELDIILSKLVVQLHKMNAAVESIEALLSEAHRSKGWTWITTEPLWCTWPMKRFYDSLLPLLPSIVGSLEERKEVVSILRSHDLPFEQSKECLQSWSNIGPDRWEELDELFSVEVDGWSIRSLRGPD